MNKRTIIYLLGGVAALIFAVGFLLSQFVEYKQYSLSQEKAIQECVEKNVGTFSSFTRALATQKCEDMFSK